MEKDGKFWVIIFALVCILSLVLVFLSENKTEKERRQRNIIVVPNKRNKPDRRPDFRLDESDKEKINGDSISSE